MALLDYLLPLKQIAEELRTLRLLYEADLASREKPVVLATERPRKSDTEVSYMGVRDERPAYKRWFSADTDAGEDWTGEDDELDTTP